MLQAVLRPRLGWEQAVRTSTGIGMAVAVALGLWAVWTSNVLLVLIGLFVFLGAWQSRRALETGGLEEPQDFMGHDFSFGHATLRDLEKERRPGWLARWRERRRAKAESRRREEEAKLRPRVDALLEKISREGMGSLTEEERGFLKGASRRFGGERGKDKDSLP